MLMQVWPQERVVCRLSGTDIVRAAGVNLTGLDIIEQSPQAFRKERLARYSNCFDGFIHRSVRNMPNMNGETIRSELLILPFRDLREDGSKVALVSADWVTERDDRLRAVSDAFIVPEFAEYLPV